MIRRALQTFAIAALVCLALMAVNVWRFSPRPASASQPLNLQVDPQAIAANLGAAIRIATVSHESPSDRDPAAFDRFRVWLETTYPGAHRVMRREEVSGGSLLYTWAGDDASVKPIILMAHMDVVPVEPGTSSAWTHPPFAGEIADGFVWGRGTLDDKTSLVAIFEAIERLVARGFTPRRTVYVALGHDEELGGEGARAMADLLAARGVVAESVLDEGGVIADGLIDGMARPVALVGIAEKGIASVELSVEQAGGHSSMPPPSTAVGLVARAIARVEANPMPARLRGAAAQLFDVVGREMPFVERAIFANLFVFERLVVGRLERNPMTNALVRTTTAATMAVGGVKDNVLPSRARAVINFRILPGDSVRRVVEHVERAVDDSRVKVRALSPASEPSPTSRTSGRAWEVLSASVAAEFSRGPVAPWLVVGATDARHFTRVAPDVYRFIPVPMRDGDPERAHGRDERVGADALAPAVRFYARYVMSAAEAAREAQP